MSPSTWPSVLKTVQRPRRALVTAGMPYANGPLHLGHLAGAHLPADIYSRWMGMLIGRENVLFVNGTDDHGSTSEVSAAAAGIPIRQFIDGIHARQQVTLARYAIGVDVYTGTSQPETFPIQKQLCDFFLTRLHAKRHAGKAHQPAVVRPPAQSLPARPPGAGDLPQPEVQLRQRLQRRVRSLRPPARADRAHQPEERAVQRHARDARHRPLVSGHVEGVGGAARLD